MTTPAGRDGRAPEGRRVPFSERVEVKYKLFQEFVSELSANLSLGGMFLATRLPREPGSQFQFQIRLEDDFALIEGTGEVVWRRGAAEGPARPAGMGVRFVTLTVESHRLIRRIVEEHAKGGGRPFDLAQEAPAPGAAVEEEPPPVELPPAESPPAEPPPVEPPPAEPPVSLPPPTEVGSARRTGAPAPPSTGPSPPVAGGPPKKRPAAPPAAATPSTTPSPPTTPSPAAGPAAPAFPPALEPPPPAFAPGAATASESKGRGWPASVLRLGALALLSAAVGGLVVWTGHRIFIQPQLEALARQVDELSHEAGARAAAARPPRGDGPEGEAAASPAATAPSSLPEDDPIEAVRAWARAWSEKRFDDYLAAYSREFRPPDGLSRAAWEAQRRSRILRPGAISVTVAAMDAEDLGGARMLVRCTQSYRSARYSDVVRKAILLVREEDAWRILEERVER